MNFQIKAASLASVNHYADLYFYSAPLAEYCDSVCLSTCRPMSVSGATRPNLTTFSVHVACVSVQQQRHYSVVHGLTPLLGGTVVLLLCVVAIDGHNGAWAY